MRFNYEKALDHLQAAEQMIGTRPMGDIPALVNSGIGLASLALGHLGEARKRWKATDKHRYTGIADPWMIVVFEARMLAKEHRYDELAEKIHSRLPQLESRFPIAWVKAWAGIAPLLRRIRGRPAIGTEEIARAIEVGENRGAYHWVEELRRATGKARGWR